jgi:hypothetical protein
MGDPPLRRRARRLRAPHLGDRSPDGRRDQDSGRHLQPGGRLCCLGALSAAPTILFMADETARRGALIAGGVFAVTFLVGLVLVGDQAGAFADSERAYAAHFADTRHRIEDLTGSALLIVSAVAFGLFSQFMASSLRLSSGPYVESVVKVSGMLSAAAILVAGGAFMTVPGSLALGDLFDDPGIVTAQPVLPSLGYMMLVAGAVIPAAVLMVASTRLGVYPRWFVIVTVVITVFLVLTAPMFGALALLSIWVAAAAFIQSRHGNTDPALAATPPTPLEPPPS